MATREIKTKLVLDGEAQYRKGLEASYKALSQLGKEMKITQASYADSGDAMQQYTAKTEALKRAIDGQKQLIHSLAERIRYANTAYKDNTEAQELYARKIETAQKAIGRMEKELQKTEKAMGEVTDETKDAGHAMDTTADETQQMGKAATNASASVEKLAHGFTVMKGVMSNLLTDAFRRARSAITGFVGDSLEVASDMQEVDNVVSTAFKDQTKAVVAFANKASQQYGLSALEAQNYAGKLGAALNALGLKDKALEMSTTLTGLAGDLASFWNMTADETYSKVFAGVISGETEGLKSLGIVMTETNLQAFALSEGIKKKYSAMTADEKAMLRYKYVLQMTAEAQGDFAKTSGSYANQLKITQLNVSNLKNAFGNGLLPAVTKIYNKFNDLSSETGTLEFFERLGEKAGELTEGAFVKLNDALKWIASNTSTVKTVLLSLGSGVVVAKVMKLVAGFTSMISTIKQAGLAATLLSSGLGGLPFAAAVAGAAALTAGVLTIINNVDSLDKKMRDLKFGVDASSQADITAAINQGVEAADKKYDISVQVRADTTELATKLKNFFEEDSRGGTEFTRKEWKAATKMITDYIQPDVDAACKLVADEKAKLEESLRSLTTVDGEQVYSESEIKEITATMTQETQGLIDELNAARDGANNLLAAIYDQKRSPTEQELQLLDTYMERIARIQTELRAAQDEQVRLEEINLNRVERGKGSTEDVVRAGAFVAEQGNKNIEENRKKAQEELLALQDTKDAIVAAGKETDEIDRQIDETVEKHAAMEAKLSAANAIDLSNLFSGYADALPEAQKALEAVAQLRDLYAEMDSMLSNEDLTTFDMADWIAENGESLLGLGVIDESTLQNLKDNAAAQLAPAVTSIVMDVAEELQTKASEASLDMEDNPLLEIIEGWLQAGSLDNIDVSYIQGDLMEALKALEWVDLGTDVKDGIVLGIQQGAESMTADEVAGMRDNLLSRLREIFDSHSPARTMIPLGQDIVAGILEPIRTGDAGDNSSVSDIISEFKAIILKEFEGIGDELNEIGTSAGSGYAMGILARSGMAMSAARAVASSAYAGASGYTGQFYSIGYQMMMGMVDGINAGSYEVTSAITAAMREAVAAAEDELDIHSPSKVFAWIGKMSAEGFGVGFDDQLRTMESVIRDGMRGVAQVPTRAGAYGEEYSMPGAAASGGITIYQTVNANETSYAAQQREAARSFAAIARRL